MFVPIIKHNHDNRTNFSLPRHDCFLALHTSLDSYTTSPPTSGPIAECLFQIRSPPFPCSILRHCEIVSPCMIPEHVYYETYIFRVSKFLGRFFICNYLACLIEMDDFHNRCLLKGVPRLRKICLTIVR